MVHDKVVQLLKEKGPLMPVEISNNVGYDSFVMRAVLLELINQGLIKRSKRPIGSSLIYYLPEHENKMRELIYNDLGIPQKKVLHHLREIGRVDANHLTPHERAFINELADFLKVEKINESIIITFYDYKPKTEITPEPIQPPIIPSPTPVIPEPTSVTREPEPIPNPPEIKPINQELRLFDNKITTKKATGFEAKTKEYLESLGEITKTTKIKNDSEYDYELRTTKPFEQEFTVKAKKKTSISETDLSIIYAEAIHQKKPAILLTNGKLTSKAKKWKDANAGGLIQIIEI